MRVLEHEPGAWTLFGERGTMFLEASCKHGHFGYSVLIRLDAQETTDYCVDGRAFLARLAKAIQDTRTGQRDSTSPYQARDIATLYSDKIASAVEAWQAGQGDAGEPPKGTSG